MIKNVQEIIRQKVDKGLNTYKNFFNLAEGQTPASINTVYNNDGSFGKRLGASTTNTVVLESTAGYGMYDFGVLGVGGNDVDANLLLHCDGVGGSATFTDSSRRAYSVTAIGGASIDTAQSKFGGASGLFPAPEDSNTVLLLHCDGADASTIFTDETGKAVTANGNAQIDTAQSKFGGASGLFDGTGDYLSLADSVDWDFGTGDFTVDFWIRFNSTAGSQYFIYQTGAWSFFWNGTALSFNSNVTGSKTFAFSPSVNIWYHFGLIRTGGDTLRCFVDGVQAGVDQTNSDNITGGTTLFIGDDSLGNGQLNGWLDEIRVSKGIARWTANFTAPSNPYHRGYLTIPDNDDWYFGLGNFTIDKQVRFNSVLTSQMLIGQGSNANNQWYLQYGSAPNSLFFRSYSGGTLVVNVSGLWTPATATWYHLALVRQTTNNWYIFVDGSSLAAAGTTAGIIPQLASLLKVGINVVTTNNTALNGWLDELRVSNNARWIAAFTSPTVAYNSDIMQERRLLCAAGTGIYYSTDIGRTWAIIQTNRTANINYFGFIKDYVINTNESYDPPQYWAGTAAQYFANISTAAPACKHSASHQGFALLLNESANKTGFYYVDQNDMFTKAWSNFKLPTDRNDELTTGFTIGRSLYVSSKYKIFRLNFIGGNPDWEYVEVRNWGFVPKTVKKINLPGIGESVIGLDWTKKIRIFFGADDEIISDHLSKDNGITPFYLDNISSINLNKCWAEDDKKAQVYRLFLAYGGSSTISYSLCFNYRAGSWYPENNRPYQSGVLAADTADNLHMLGCNYNGRVTLMDSGNIEAGVAIDDQHISPFLYQQSPSRVFKSQQMNMFFAVSSSGTIFLEDRSQFSSFFSLRKEMTLASAISSIQIRQSVDIPESMNVYQFKLSSSANTADPWQCNLIDLSLSDLGIGK